MIFFLLLPLPFLSEHAFRKTVRNPPWYHTMKFKNVSSGRVMGLVWVFFFLG